MCLALISSGKCVIKTGCAQDEKCVLLWTLSEDLKLRVPKLSLCELLASEGKIL